MLYPLRNKKNTGFGKQYKIPVVFFAVLLIVELLSPGAIGNAVVSVGNVIWKAKTSVLGGTGNLFSSFSSNHSLVLENEALKKFLDMKQNELAELRATARENRELQDLLGRKRNYVQKAIGLVIAKPPLIAYDTAIIDVGLESGIKVGDKIMWEGSILGEVGSVENGYSTVVFYSQAEKNTKVFIGENNIQADALGLGAGNFSIRLPIDAVIKEGDRVTIPNYRRYDFGLVMKIEKSPANPFQVCYFRIPINLDTVKWLEVIE